MMVFKRVLSIRLFLLTIVVVIAGCATPPPPAAPEKTTLSAMEKATYQNALSNIAMGENDKAVNELKKISQAHPDFFAGWLNLATAHYHSGKIPEASTALANATKINPSVAEVHNLSGLLNVETGNYKAAEKDYLAALELKKDYPAAHYNLANLYDIFYQDINKAIPHYEHYILLSGNTDKSTISWLNELKAKLKRSAK